MPMYRVVQSLNSSTNRAHDAYDLPGGRSPDASLASRSSQWCQKSHQKAGHYPDVHQAWDTWVASSSMFKANWERLCPSDGWNRFKPVDQPDDV